MEQESLVRKLNRIFGAFKASLNKETLNSKEFKELQALIGLLAVKMLPECKEMKKK